MQRVAARALAVPRAVSAATAASAAVAPARAMSTAGTAYKLVFRRNVTYISYIIGGAIVLEAVYGTVTDGIWNSLNAGVRGSAPRACTATCAPRLRAGDHLAASPRALCPAACLQRSYDQVDWSKFREE